jgi:TRAP transporter TAXI family solute receptor
MKFKKMLILILFVSFFMVSTVLVYGNSISWKGTWSTGGIGGSWYSQGVALAELIKEKEPGIEIRCTPGGGIVNLMRVENGDWDLGFTITPFSFIAKQGYEPFKKPYVNIRSIAGSFVDLPYNFLAAKKTGIKTIEEFIQLIKDGKKVRLVTSTVGLTEEFLLRKILEYYNLTYDDIRNNNGKIFFVGQNEQVSLMTDRHADFWFICSGANGAPSSPIIQVLVNRELQFLNLPDDLLQSLYQKYNVVKGKLLATDYPNTLEEDMGVLIGGTSIIVNKNVPEEVVYAITKILNENPERIYLISPLMKSFDPKTAGQKEKVAIKLHPGAERYYKEQGYLYYNE